MKILKRVLFLVLGLIAFLFLGLLIYTNTLKPTYNGEKDLTGLAKDVEVYYDTYGVPHIYATNKPDAFRALGYVHAQDRLWQMELLRRVATGGLSEVFGADLVDTDKFFLTLGIDEHSKKVALKLTADSEVRQLAEAYVAGVNAFIDEGPTPAEFILTGIDKTHFKVEDILNTVGYMAFTFAHSYKVDPLLTDIKNELGDAYLSDFDLESDPSTVRIKSYEGAVLDSMSINITTAAHKALDKLPIPQLIGSNSWVLAPEKTKNGKVILANDPHIGFAQPSVWYEAHVVTPTYERYGYHLGGVPYPMLAHNRNNAFGLTMFVNDDNDFYFEEVNPNDNSQYKTEAGWKSFGAVTKTIKVKDGEDVTYTYRTSRHGPIVNDVVDQITSTTPISMSWKYTQIDGKVIDAVYEMNHASNLAEFEAALPKIHAPGLNVMYGDKDGNVGWWACAALYKMPDSVSTKFILDGSEGKEEPVEFLDFSKNPHAVNPSWNYVYSANNQPDTVAGNLYAGYYLPEHRAKRIVKLLEPKNDWDKESVKNMMVDITSSNDAGTFKGIAKHLNLEGLSEEQITFVEKLNKWDGSYERKSVEGTVYHRLIYQMVKHCLEDELGTVKFNHLLKTNSFKKLIPKLVANSNSIWWDDTTTKEEKESMEVIVTKAFRVAWVSLETDLGKNPAAWHWEKVHTLEHEHPFGRIKWLRKKFNVGPFPVHGSVEVINNLGFPYDSTGYQKVTFGPSTRRVIDFSDIENSESILPTGQSGNPFSPHYEDQAEMYAKGEFRKMLMNEEEIKDKSKNKLVLKAVN